MSHLWPHSSYAEEQPFSHLILTTHVFTRALTMGTIIGPLVAAPLHLLRRSKTSSTPATSTTSSTSPSISTSPAPRLPLPRPTAVVLRSAGVGAGVTMGLMVIGLPYHMWGREPIEWQDRSWRLLENKGQLEVDKWTYAGVLVGGLVAASKRSTSSSLRGWRGTLGCLGLGSLGGTIGYMGWRYGVKGGKFDDAQETVV